MRGFGALLTSTHMIAIIDMRVGEMRPLVLVFCCEEFIPRFWACAEVNPDNNVSSGGIFALDAMTESRYS